MKAFAASLSHLLAQAADRVAHVFGDDAIVASHELHFDSDAYLADLKDRVLSRYY